MLQALLAVVICGGLQAAPAEVSPRTNVVFIMTDDQGIWSLGCYGHAEPHTPGVDRLAAEGVRFTQAFATTPVCSPSRATFFTGRIPSQHGIHDWIKHENMGERARYCLVGETLISEVLAEHGYTCGMVGKWHLGDSLGPHAAYSYWFAMLQGSGPYQNSDMIWNGQVIKTTGYATDRITDHAVEFLELNRDKPFFLNVSYGAPHSPWRDHPQELVDLYKDCKFDSIPKLPTHPWSAFDVERLRNHEILSQYFAACSGVSRGVERIMATLDTLRLTEKTLVIYTSDQGFCVGHHGLWSKGNASNPRNMYDTSLRIPLIWRQPGRLPQGTSSEVLFSAYDFVPTLLAYLGLPPSPGRNLPGQSFAKALEGQAQKTPDAVFGEYGRTRMIRTRNLKYVHRADGGPHELYDLEKDPGETDNLADRPEHRSRLIALRSRLFDWFERYGEAGRDPVGQEYLRPADKE
ncbi:MAG: sulfatase-like hydrolase/transferase [Phycisphaerae bacterium]|nr:sulfatase-like hydrolase/transferase [Phycisphaerae bacterium]